MKGDKYSDKSTSGALKSRTLPLYCRGRQATHVLADPDTRQLARSSAFAGAKCRGRQVPGAALPGRCRHAQLPAIHGPPLRCADESA